MQVQINPDNVVFEGTTWQRPQHISRSDWMLFWEGLSRNGIVQHYYDGKKFR